MPGRAFAGWVVDVSRHVIEAVARENALGACEEHPRHVGNGHWRRRHADRHL